MSDSTKIIKDGFIQIMSPEGEALYKALTESGLLFEQLSVIFNDYATAHMKGSQVATKADIISLRETIINLSSKLSTMSIGNPGIISGIPNPSLVSDEAAPSIEVSTEPSSAPVIKKKVKKELSFSEMIKVAKNQQG